MKHVRVPSSLQLLVALTVASFGAACGSEPPTTEPGDAGADSGDANVLVAAPDLRFKWVAAGFGLRVNLFTNGGVGGRPDTLTTSGPLGATPLLLSGEDGSQYYLFSTNQNISSPW